MVVARVLRDFGGAARARSSCSTTRPTTATRTSCSSTPTTTPTRRTRSATRDARVWFRGLQAICDARSAIKTVYDLSATPFYLKGSGYNEGFIFPWVVSDFSLMDAIESGIVKVPRIPVDDDAAGDQRRLPATSGTTSAPQLPKRRARRRVDRRRAGCRPTSSKARCDSLYRSYERALRPLARRELAPLGEPPPVIIVVCPNTVVSKLVFDWIAGREVELADGTTRLAPGNLPLLQQRRRRRVDRRGRARSSSTPPSSSPASRSSADFKKAAAHEIEAFKAELPARATPAPTSTSSPTRTCCAR